MPTDEEWGQLATRSGGEAAYKKLVSGGGSGFDVLLGGGRAVKGEYARLNAHGFYWTATESEPGTAVYYNFASGGLALHRQTGGEKQRTLSVRCIQD